MDQGIEFCCKALRGGNFRALCREYGISAKTGYKWQERFLRGLERCEPLTVRDEYSRYLLELRALEDARSLTVQKRFERLFECYGLPEAIRSDNGSPFASRSAVHGLSRLSAWWIALGIDLERGRPGHPQDNGAHERLHRDISLELQCLGRIDQNSLELWRQEFNEQRPHEALGMRCPSELYRHSARPYRGGVRQLDYPQMMMRRVNHTGLITWANHELFISSSLAGWSVGLKPVEQEQLEVWWCPWLQFATYPQSPSSGPVRCCDVTDLYQAFSQRTGPGRLWISLSAPFVAGFGYPPNPKINTRYFTQANNLKTCNLQTQSVTHVLNQKCYLCSDCACAGNSDFCILSSVFCILPSGFCLRRTARRPSLP
jgi:hypothetical protein